MRPVLLSDTVHTDSFTAYNNNNNNRIQKQISSHDLPTWNTYDWTSETSLAFNLT